jgi:acyl carrier protein
MRSNDERLKECLVTSLRLEAKGVENIETNTSLLELGVTSISFIKAVVSIENEFDFEFQDENLDFTRFKTYGDILKLIEEEIGENS